MRERDRRVYKVTFLNQGQVYEIYAKKVAQGGLLGFVEVEGIVFGQKTTVVVGSVSSLPSTPSTTRS